MRNDKMKSQLFGAILVVGLSRICAAHAMLDHAEPKVGAEVVAAPAKVRIWYTQELEPAFSVISVFDSSGNEVDKKDSHVDDNDKTELIVSLPAMSTCVYKVSWHVVSVDTHKTQGDFKFTVKAAN